MGRQTQFVVVPTGDSEFDRFQHRLAEALRVTRQSPQAIVTAKGSIVAASGDGQPVEHPVGANRKVLVADSTQITGLRWGAALPWVNVIDYGADPTGVLDSTAAFTAALAAGHTVWVPAGTYALFSGITIPTGTKLFGEGPGATTITYSGAATAITMQACQFSEASGFKLVTTSSNAAVRGMSLLNTGATDSKWNRVSDIYFVQNNATHRIAGQIGLLVQNVATGAQYWNHFENLRFVFWDTCMELLGCTVPAADGANQNYIADILCATFNIGLLISTNCNDNQVHGLFGTHSSAAAFTDTLLVIGDGVNASNNNLCFGVTSDMGANGNAFEIKAAASGNFVVADNESTNADIDSGTSSQISDTKNISGASQQARFVTLQTTSSASISGNLATGAAQLFTKTHFVADAAYTATTADYYIGFQTLTATRIVTLPSAASMPGGWLLVKDESGAAAAGVKIQLKAGTAGQSVDGVASPGTLDVIVTAYGKAQVHSNGTNWFTV